MCAHNGRVQNQVLQIRVIDAVLMKPFPDALLTPAGEAFVDAVPVTILFG